MPLLLLLPLVPLLMPLMLLLLLLLLLFPSGEFSINLHVDEQADPPQVLKAGLLRTARLLSRGELYVPEHIFITE